MGLTAVESLRMQAERLDLDAIARLADMLAERQVWNCPTLVVNQAVLRRVEDAMADPRLKYQSAPRLATWDPRADFRRRTLLEHWDEVLAAGLRWLDCLFEVTRILHRAGAPLILGTDTPNPFVNQGFSVHRELENLVRCGLSPYEALLTATASPARFMHEDDRWGTLHIGRAGDLVVVRGNPLEDLSVLASPVSVLLNGWVLDNRDLRSLLEQRQAHVAMVQSLPEPELPSGEGEVVREGRWIEHVSGAPTACACHSHRRLPSSDIEVDEALEAEARRRRTHLVLAPDLTVREGFVETVTSFGTERIEIERAGASYRVRTRQVDGEELVSVLETDPLVPSEKLGPSVLPALLAWSPGDACTLQALTVDDGRAAAVEVQVGGEGRPIPAAEGAVAVVVPRVEDPSYLRVRASPDGALEELAEMTIWGLRTVRPENG